ncbi:MAG: hypothetical protein K5681_03195 [Treponema sp.]|nr:hypothetical protein [Treponema sp.]
MKKFSGLVLIFSTLLLTSCWIQPQSENYELLDDTYYFYDYDAMKSVTVPLINDTFTDWHYGKSKFDKRYKEYYGNIDANEDNLSVIEENGFSYAVKINTSSKTVSLNDSRNTVIQNKYIWITNSQGVGTVFFKN